MIDNRPTTSWSRALRGNVRDTLDFMESCYGDLKGYYREYFCHCISILLFSFLLWRENWFYNVFFRILIFINFLPHRVDGARWIGGLKEEAGRFIAPLTNWLEEIRFSRSRYLPSVVSSRDAVSLESASQSRSAVKRAAALMSQLFNCPRFLYPRVSRKYGPIPAEGGRGGCLSPRNCFVSPPPLFFFFPFARFLPSARISIADRNSRVTRFEAWSVVTRKGGKGIYIYTFYLLVNSLLKRDLSLDSIRFLFYFS